MSFIYHAPSAILLLQSIENSDHVWNGVSCITDLLEPCEGGHDMDRAALGGEEVVEPFVLPKIHWEAPAAFSKGLDRNQYTIL